jgi:hypothetical protein
MGLPVLTLTFIYNSHRKSLKPSVEEEFFRASVEKWQLTLEKQKRYEDLKRGLLEFFRESRHKHIQEVDSPGKNYEEDRLITAEYIGIQERFGQESRSMIREALEELADGNLIFGNGHGGPFYLAPSAAEVREAVSHVRAHPFVVFRNMDEKGKDPESLILVRSIGEKFRYPSVVVAKYIYPHISDLLRQHYLSATRLYFEICVSNDERGREACKRLLHATEEIPKIFFDLTGEQVLTRYPSAAQFFEAEMFPNKVGMKYWHTHHVSDFLENSRTLARELLEKD